MPAIVAPALDIDLLEKQIAVALKDQRDAERTADRHEQMAASARETARMRRMEVGKSLCGARKAWPERGPNAKGWGEFLARLKLDDSTAHRYMQEFRDPVAFAQRNAGETPDMPAGDREPRVNGNGGSGDPLRGSWCTPQRWATAIGSWDLDPFSNPRSLIDAKIRCSLEDGGDGLEKGEPGTFRYRTGPSATAASDCRVFIQPPYDLVLRAIAHYGHTRFCALLRFDTSTEWFEQLIKRTRVIAFPLERIAFDPPPGVEASSNPYPHAFYYADERDVAREVYQLCLVVRVEQLPNQSTFNATNKET